MAESNLGAFEVSVTFHGKDAQNLIRLIWAGYDLWLAAWLEWLGDGAWSHEAGGYFAQFKGD